MASPKAPPTPRGWVEAIREVALRFNDRLSQPVLPRSAGKATPPTPPPARPGVRVPVASARSGSAAFGRTGDRLARVRARPLA